MYLFVDDIRNPPTKEWVVARTANDALKLLLSNNVEILSLDHDLGNGPTGYDILKEIEILVFKNKYIAPKDIRIHSANPVGTQNMLAAIKSIRRLSS